MSYSSLGPNRITHDRIDDMADMPIGNQDWRLAISIDPRLLSSNALTTSHVQLCPLERYLAHCIS